MKIKNIFILNWDIAIWEIKQIYDITVEGTVNTKVTIPLGNFHIYSLIIIVIGSYRQLKAVRGSANLKFCLICHNLKNGALHILKKLEPEV